MKKRILHKFIAIIALSGSCFVIGAQTPENISIEMKITSDSITIGDRATLEITASYPASDLLVFPDFGEELVEGVEIVSSEKLDTLKSKDEATMRVRKRYIITSFDEGNYRVNDFRLAYRSGEETKMLSFDNEEHLTLHVKAVDIPDDFKPHDIKDVRKYSSDLWIIVLAVLFCLFIVAIALRIILGREKMLQVFTGVTVPLKSPYEKAIEKLRKLKGAKLPESGKIKEYYTELTEIIREYLEGCTGLNMMEKTSGEILDALSSTRFNSDEQTQYLRDLFFYADLAKFAKYVPGTAENEKSWQCAQAFVETGKPVPTVNENNTETNEVELKKNHDK
ncbi:MAG: hypothetical protein LBC98_02570 [Prevotellaceae bacterium]|nr:hypothetical protein [Prevotellaceae bacterium]